MKSSGSTAILECKLNLNTASVVSGSNVPWNSVPVLYGMVLFEGGTIHLGVFPGPLKDGKKIATVVTLHVCTILFLPRHESQTTDRL